MTTETDKRSGVIRPRPFARLLNLLGEQLIKDSTVALTELVKNSYDADAEWVQIRIGNTANLGRKNLKPNEEPFVEIEDDGDGMTLEILRDHWMNPATPLKLSKRKRNKGRTRKGRAIQGDKGIGRFAIFQIGGSIEIFTRAQASGTDGQSEIHLITDFGNIQFSDSEDTRKKGSVVYFDEIEALYDVRSRPDRIVAREMSIRGNQIKTEGHGTLIRITQLRYPWSEDEVRKVLSTLNRIQSPFHKSDFIVSVVFEGKEIADDEARRIHQILDEAVIKCSGSVDARGDAVLNINEKENRLDLVDKTREDFVAENKLRFFDKEGKAIRQPVCGPFKFHFYVFDLKKITDPQTKKFIKDHRVYVYRDGIRIYPYGDPDNDWLKIDMYRGTIRASYYLSNNDVMGYVDISASHNQNLVDKTSREGFIEQTGAFEDLRVLTLMVLSRLKIEFQRYISGSEEDMRERRGQLYSKQKLVLSKLDSLQSHLVKKSDTRGAEILNRVASVYKKERELVEKQLDMVEDLAGIGIAVDATSHDVMVMMRRMDDGLKAVEEIAAAERPDIHRLRETLASLRDQLDFVTGLMEGIQPIFRSARRKGSAISVENVVKKVWQYYAKSCERSKIAVSIKKIAPKLEVAGTEGVFLQLFINLFDNAVYWLGLKKERNAKFRPEIQVLIDGQKRCVLFADNGDGVDKENIPYIFEPFFSTKGLAGRGLGLYIARQLVEKYEYQMSYVGDSNRRLLGGANFLIDFKPTEKLQ